MEAGMVLSLSAFFSVQTLLLCEDHGDLMQNLTEEFLANRMSWNLLVTDKETVSKDLEQVQSSLVLVVCTNFDYETMNLGEKDLLSDVIWLVPHSSIANLTRYSEKLPLRLDSFVLSYDSRNVIRETYAVQKRLMLSNIFGYFDRGSLNVSVPFVWERRRDLKGIKLINTVLPWSPMIVVHDSMSISGMFPDILSVVERAYNFSFDNRTPRTKVWGLLKTLDNGTSYWNGMVGELAEGRADICASSLTMTQERLEVVDFTISILEDMVVPFVPSPSLVGQGEADVNLAVFITVFTVPTWVAVMVTAILSAGIHAAVMERKRFDTLLQRCKAFLTGTHYFFNEMIQRGEVASDQFGFISSKIFYLSLAALCFVLFNFYVADLTATMTVGRSPVQLESFQDVIDKDFTLYALGGTFTEGLFKAADPSSPMGVVYSAHYVPVESTNDYTAVLKEKVLSAPNTAVFESVLTYAADEELQAVTAFTDRIESQLAFGLAKGSEFRGLFNYALGKMSQTGILGELAYKWLQGRRPSDMSDRIFVEEVQPLGFENLFFPSLAMLAGLITATALVMCEKALFSSKENENKVGTLRELK